MSIIAVIIAFVLAAVLAIAVPVAIGVYVYKDARERHMNPVLWTVIAVLAPGFIGFIIYLIARNDHPALSCPKCGHGISESFAVCPSCGYSLKNNCPFCGRPLEPDWNICPNCSNPIPEDMKIENPVKPKKDKGIGKILALIILIPLFLCVLLIAVIATLSFSTYNNALNESTNLVSEVVSDISKSQVECEGMNVQEWFNDCDKKGEGVYILKAVDRDDLYDPVTTKYLIYRNDGAYNTEFNEKKDGLFENPEITASYTQTESSGTSLVYYEYSDIGRSEAELTVVTDGINNENLEIITVSDIDIKNSRVPVTAEPASETQKAADIPKYEIDVDISDDINTIYSIKIEIKDESGSVITGNVITDINDRFLQDSYSYYLSESEAENTDSITVTCFDKDGKTVVATEEKRSVTDFVNDNDIDFEVEKNIAGEIVISRDY